LKVKLPIEWALAGRHSFNGQIESMIFWLIEGVVWIVEAVVGAARILTGNPPRRAIPKQPPDRPANERALELTSDLL
jgi:hypothetical protein